MAIKKYIEVWAEEDHNYSDLMPALLNYGPKAEKKFGYGLKEAMMFGKGFHAEFYMTPEEIERTATFGLTFFSSKKKFEKLLKEIKIATKNLKERINETARTDLSKLSSKEFGELYDYFGFRLGEIFVCYSMTDPHKIKKIEEKIIDWLKHKNANDAFEGLGVLATPDQRFEFVKDNPLFKSFSEIVMSENARIDKKLKERPLYVTKRQSQAKRNALIKKLKVPKKLDDLSKRLGILASERLKMRFTWMLALYYQEAYLGETKRRYNIAKKTLRQYDLPELDALLQSGKKVSAATLKKRQKGFMKILDYGKFTTLEGAAAVRFRDKASVSHDEELSGLVASPGIVQGRVVIFSYKKSSEHARKIKKMSPGDIVVTEMTRPNIIAACEKAGAIITDEGGVLSHAAIVSRELHVPCIIGTGSATKVLKDGDLVEVDAKKGLIKKIAKISKTQSKQLRPAKKQRKKADVRYNKRRKEDILAFSQVTRLDIPTVGGKGAHLGELVKVGFVPPGFCITVNAYERFVNKYTLAPKIKKILANINLEDARALKQKATQVQKLILAYKMDPHLSKQIAKHYNTLKGKCAIRSSATAEDLPGASFAGQQDTYLNVRGLSNVVSSVQKCWASLFTPRAIHYREKQGFSHADVLISVVVQQMADAQYAGVVFTKDPLGSANMVIEVVKGLGEKLVSGEVTPNSYTISRQGKVLQKREHFDFSRSLLKKLVKEGIKVEKHFGSPQDIELAIDAKGKIWLLQSRAITTL